MKKTIAAFLIFSIIMLSMIVLISGCSNARNEIYSDDVKIAQSESYHTTMWVPKHSDNKYSLTADTLTGLRTIWRYDAEDDEDVEMFYSLSVSNGGKAKLVLVTPDDEVIILSENTDNRTVSELESQIVSLKAGNNRIKIVGYDKVKFELKLNIEVGEFGTRERE